MPTVNSGPIPGANQVRDTKNYPWHQPSKITDLDTAIDFLVKKLTDFKIANAVLTMVEMGVTVVKSSQVILMQGVSQGYWSVDLALLLSGPLTRIIELICIGYDVKYDLGINDDPDDFETGTFFQKQQALRAPIGGFKLIDTDVNEVKQAADDQGDSGTPNDQTGSGQGAPTDPNAGQAQEQPLQTSGFMAMSGPAAQSPQPAGPSKGK